MEKLHDKHRLRLREKFLCYGLDSFADHEVIELLLFYSRPRVNTNPIAHALLNRFGSLSDVFEADPEDLMSVKGVGEASASLIKLMLPIMKRYESDRVRSRDVYASKEKIGGYLVNRFIGETREKVLLVLFDASDHIIDVVCVHEGSVTSSDINPNKIAEIVFSRRAAGFVVAHNHPGGRTEPSKIDLLMTRELYKAFSGFDVRLREHFIIAGKEYRPILDETLKEYPVFC
ncbi:MAG: RadC family protein [Clostridia bacterium]|nr:RadC family protein [Clostridia bacterium]